MSLQQIKARFAVRAATTLKMFLFSKGCREIKKNSP